MAEAGVALQGLDVSWADKRLMPEIREILEMMWRRDEVHMISMGLGSISQNILVLIADTKDIKIKARLRDALHMVHEAHGPQNACVIVQVAKLFIELGCKDIIH